MTCTARWIYNPFFNRSVGSADRLTRRRREPYVPESPQLSSAPPGPQPDQEICQGAQRKEERRTFWGDWRGTIPQLPRMEAPCRVCGEHNIERQRFAFSEWIAHMVCVVENVQCASERGDDQFGVVVRKGYGSPRRRTFHLTEIIPRIQQRFNGATEWGGHTKTGTVGTILALSDVGGGGSHEPCRKRPTGTRECG